jgi:hypothetical protein
MVMWMTYELHYKGCRVDRYDYGNRETHCGIKEILSILNIISSENPRALAAFLCQLLVKS